MTDIWQLDEKKQVDIAEKVSRVFKSGEIDRSDKNLSEALKVLFRKNISNIFVFITLIIQVN